MEPNAFKSCEYLAEIYIPDSVGEIGKYAFEYCENLTKIYIPDSVTAIEDGAFEGCKNLAEVYIPDELIDIEKNAFPENCTIYMSNSRSEILSVISEKYGLDEGSLQISDCNGISMVIDPDNNLYAILNQDGNIESEPNETIFLSNTDDCEEDTADAYEEYSVSDE